MSVKRNVNKYLNLYFGQLSILLLGSLGRLGGAEGAGEDESHRICGRPNRLE